MADNNPAGVVPYLIVSDGAGAIDFYARAFGATELHRMSTPDGSKVVHAALGMNGGTLFLADDFPEMNEGRGRTPEALGGTGVTLHLEVADVDAVVEQAVAAGATVTMPVADMFWGARFGKLTDPFGHDWSVSTQTHQPSEEEKNKAVEQVFG